MRLGIICRFLGLGVLLIFGACSREEGKVYNDFNGEYLVQYEVRLNDSLLPEKTIEYFAGIDLLDNNYSWKKRFFTRTFDTNSVDGTFFVFDSLYIHSRINSKAEIVQIVNWSELYQKVSGLVSSMVDTTSQGYEEVKDLVENVSLDSSLIVAKNTQDMAVFLAAFRFSMGEDVFPLKVIRIKDEGDYRISSFDFEANKTQNNAAVLRLLRSFTEENIHSDFRIQLEIVVHRYTQELEQVKYVVSQEHFEPKTKKTDALRIQTTISRLN